MIIPRISNRNWSLLVIGLCSLGGHAVNLIPFSYGILQVYIYSYLYEANNEITKAQMHMHAPLVLGMATGTAWSFGLFVRYVHPVILHVINGVALSGWMILLYFFTDNYIVITVSMTFVGFHLGQLHIFFSQRVTEEGKTRSSSANGFYGFWFGVAGVWGNLLGFFYFNPSNLPSSDFTDADGKIGTLFKQEEILDKVPTMWLILAVVLFFCFLPGYFVIGITRKGRPASMRSARFPSKRRDRSKSIIARVVENSYGLEEEDEQEGTSSANNTAPIRIRLKKRSIATIKEVDEQAKESNISVVSGVGLVLFTTTVGIGVSSLCAFELFKEFGTSGEHNASADKFYNLAGIIIPVVGALGRILWGILGDKVSYRILFVVGNVLSVILQVSMAPGRVDKYLYVAIVSVLAIMPGMMTLLPPAIKHFMGNKDIGLKFGMVLTGEVFGCMYYLLFASVLRKHISDLILMLVLSLPSALALFPTLYFLGRSTKKEEEITVLSNRASKYDSVEETNHS
ncbi:uncharacterized protein LOC134818210 isoform X2 [Bolinopsis microptera]|uniref:uncharacterized protein LOC134818210 isoform X2 n=1 Tax=Bolinopsis microptera TaxID=2820187 RepID=UPI003079894B